MGKIILFIIAAFFVVSGFDYLRGNKWGIGDNFKEGINTTGMLIISMVGIYSLSPLIGKIIGVILVPIGDFFNIDPAIFPSMFLAIDMGALGIAETLALDSHMYVISGVIIASTLGATISFSIPLALGLIDNKYEEDFSKGLAYGIIAMPIAPLIAGLMLDMNLKSLLINIWPIIIISILLCIGMFKYRQKLIIKFTRFASVIKLISIMSLLYLGFSSIMGLDIIDGMIPLSDSLAVVGKMALFLGGTYPLLEFIIKKCENIFIKLGKVLNIDNYSISFLIISLASNIILFKNYSKMSSKGRVLCTAFSINGAFVLGGQMGFVSSKLPEVINIYIISKIIAGIVALTIAAFTYENNVERENIIDKDLELV